MHMKKTYVITFCSLIFGYPNIGLFAQPIITHANNGLINGQAIVAHTYNYSGFSPGSIGSNVTWNFANIGNTSTLNTAIENPTTTPAAPQFPTATNSIHYLPGTFYQYFYNNTNEFSQLGAYNGTTSISFNDRELVYSYPCTYNSQGSDFFSSTYTNGGYTFYRSGTSSFIADGYGTLILPYGTLNNVLRVKFIENYQDSTNISGIPFVTPYQNTQYIWLRPNTHFFVLTFYTLVANGSIQSNGYYVDQSSVGLDSPDQLTDINIYPNPAEDHVTIDLVDGGREFSFQLINATGQTVLSEISNETIINSTKCKINTTGLPRGVYILRIYSDGQTGSKKIVLH